MTDAAALEAYLANCFRTMLRERRRRRIIRLAGIVAIIILAVVLDLIGAI